MATPTPLSISNLLLTPATSSFSLTSRSCCNSLQAYSCPAKAITRPLAENAGKCSQNYDVRLRNSEPKWGRCAKSAGGVARASIGSLKIPFPFTSGKGDREKVKEELLNAIKGVDRGAEASTEDELQIEKVAKKLEALSPTKGPLKSALLNGKWQLLYTTSRSILKKDNPKFLRPWGPIYQSINTDTLRAQNMETWPFFNQVTANLVPLSASKVAVKFDVFKIAGLINIKAPGRARGELEITYLDENLRISRGDKGNLFILKMVDPDYKVPL